MSDTATALEVLSTAQERGVTNVEFRYDGSGDEGYIHDIDAQNIQGGSIELSFEERRVLMDWAEELLYQDYPGWEINEGSCGEIVLSAGAGQWTYQHTHNARVERYVTTESDGSL